MFFLAHQKVVLILELEWFPTVSPTEMSRSTYIDAEFHGEYISDVLPSFANVFGDQK